jgi:ribonucleoside-diphosphate reductase alpha chain
MATLDPVPSMVDGATFRRETPAGTVRVTINAQDGRPFEVFIFLGRAGSETQSFCEALGRMLSAFLRVESPVPPVDRLKLAAEQLTGIGGANQMGFGPERVLSVVDAIGQILRAYPQAMQEAGADVPPA